MTPGDAPVAPVDSLEIQVVRQNGVSETIEVYRNIVNLRLYNQRLISIFLPEGLSNLESLNLSGNQFTSFTLPRGLTSLKELGLSGNQLTSSSLSLLGVSANLESLNLANNRLTSFTVPTGWTSLKELNLLGNQLTSLSLPDGLTNLERLDLSNNQLTSLTLPDGLTSLKWLDLSNNQLTSLTLPDGLTSLKWLYLDRNQLTSLTLSPDTASSIDSLNLQISGNPLVNISLPAGKDIDIRLDVEPEHYGISYGVVDAVGPEISRVENGLEVSWESGVLQKSARIEGPWEDVDASSPLRIFRPSLPAEFFRVRSEGSSNPPPDPDLPTDPTPLPEPGSHPLPLNGSLEGSIDPVGEEDEYQITVTDFGTLTVYSTGSMDLYGHLLDSSGNELASNDDGGGDTNFRISRLVSAGTYYVRVRHYDNSGTGDYGITSRFVEPSRLPLNGSLEGSIDPVGEEDVYQITVTGSGTLTVYSTGSMDLYGHLLDSSGNELAFNDDGGEDTNFRISHSVSAGTYYVRVRHYDNSGTGTYGITSEFR